MSKLLDSKLIAPIQYFAYVPFFGGDGVGILDGLVWLPVWIIGILVFLLLSRLKEWINATNEKKEKGKDSKKKVRSFRIF